MKRSTYFISARSHTADILGAELILALREQFNKVEGFGIVGTAMQRTRISSIATLEDCLHFGCHDRLASESESGVMAEHQQKLLQSIFQELDKSAPQTAILVGYSPLHDRLAAYFKQRDVPVVLYGMTPADGWDGIDHSQLGERIERALGMFPNEPEILRQAGIAYSYIGSPFRDRTERVHISRGAFGLADDALIVSFFPGSRVETLKSLLPLMDHAAQIIKRDHPNVEMLLPLSDFVYTEAKRDVLDRKRIRTEKDPLRFRYDPFLVLHGMALEMLSISDVAVTGAGASTIECCLLDVPFVPIVKNKMDVAADEPLCMLNQVTGEMLVAELDQDAQMVELVKRLKKLIDEPRERQKMIKAMASVKSTLQGFAAENAAEIIGHEVAKWNVKKRLKDPQPA